MAGLQLKKAEWSERASDIPRVGHPGLEASWTCGWKISADLKVHRAWVITFLTDLDFLEERERGRNEITWPYTGHSSRLQGMAFLFSVSYGYCARRSY